MEANICDVNHLDADVLLPPRKRLLAGLKKQNSDGDGSLRLSVVASPSSPLGSASAYACALSSSSPSSSEFNIRLSNLLSSHNNANLSREEIVESSKFVAAAAVKAAEAARALAEEKASIAAKAVVAAKSALDLVASFSEEAMYKERCMKKNKFKKHVPVQLLYKKYQPIENCRKDEELARKLHRAINSSPRISKNSPGSGSKGHKHKKPKMSISSEKTRDSIEGSQAGQFPTSNCNGHAVAGEVNSVQELYKNIADEKACTYEKAGQSEINNSEAESSQTKEKTWDDMSANGKKRGRVKLKKLPLSNCTFRDQANPKEEVDIRNSPLTDMNMGNPTSSSRPLFNVEPPPNSVMPIEAKPAWKCQEYKAPECVKQNKVMQS
ncbi:hypothetical protein UlMin_039584 [Ulmus minor]